MLGQTSRAALRRAAPRASPLRRSVPQRRTFFLSPPPGKRGTWKGTFARWGLVIGGIYWYNTTPTSVDDSIRQDLQQRINELPIAHTEDENKLPTIEDISAARRQRLAAAPATSGGSISDNEAPSMSTDSPGLSAAASQAAIDSADEASPAAGSSSPADLEEEAAQQGAFNEETGEINWDCPCLGGMAYGPCGPEFREAFSCFVYSKEDPKGIDCIDRFKGMQECFRQYPEHYGAELADDEDPSMDELPDAPGSEAPALQASAPTPSSAAEKVKPLNSPRSASEIDSSRQRSMAAKEQVSRDHGEGLSESKSAVPKEWHDARDKNEGK